MQDDQSRVFPRKKIATKVKHHILQSCLKAWGGIIIVSNRTRTIHLSFVDTCCGSGLYAPDEDGEHDIDNDVGSAIIGLDTLNSLIAHGQSLGASVDARALFINQNEAELTTLGTLIAGTGDNAIPYKLLPARLEDVVDKVASFCENSFSFQFIDPFGPSAIPFSVVSRLVSMSRADCLINFPYYSVHKWVGWLDRESAEGAARLQIVDQLLGSVKWRDVARRQRRDSRRMEEAVLDLYLNELAALGVAVIAVPMLFEDKNRTMYHLVFTSKNTAGLASAKRQLQEGEHYQAALRAQLKASKQHQTMFSFMNADSPTDDSVDVDALAHEIKETFAGTTVTRDHVIRFGILRPKILDAHVNKAITKLKQAGAAKPSGTKYKDLVEFKPS